jgi:hypothetical protein
MISYMLSNRGMKWSKKFNIRMALWICIGILSLFIAYKVYRLNRYKRSLPEPPTIVRVQESHPAYPIQSSIHRRIPVAPTTLHIEAADIDSYKNDLMREVEARSRLYAQPKNTEVEQTNDIVNMIAQGYVAGSQTVHDTAVQSTIKVIFQENVKNTGNDALKLDNSTEKEILRFMETSDLSPQDYKKVESALAQIQGRNASLHNLDGETEGSVVARVWKGGNENVKRQLLNELVDSTNGDFLYCPTGVVTRVLQATQIETPEAMPRTQEVLREEMLNTAARVRNELEQTEEFKQLNDSQQSEKLKSHLMETYHKEYEGVISKDIIEAETNAWIDDI